MVHAAAPCPPDIKRRMIEWWGDSIWEYYAATEGGGTIVSPQEWMKKPGTVGKAWANSEIKIFDDEGNECATGTPGTVYMLRGQADFEYYKDKEKTDKARRGKYFTVGDIGYLDADGYLFLCDRKADMIISGGVNIYPAEIESVLLTHPKIGDAAAFGIPHEEWGEEVKAVIEPIEGVAAWRRAHGRDPRLPEGPPRQVQDAEVDRLRQRDAPRPERQALQAQAPRPVLGRPHAEHLERRPAAPQAGFQPARSEPQASEGTS